MNYILKYPREWVHDVNGCNQLVEQVCGRDEDGDFSDDHEKCRLFTL